MPRHDEGFFGSKDNLRLFWESDVPDDPRAHVAVVHGYADHSGRYRGVTQHLVGQGFAVHAFDFRGHGQSAGRRGHCDRFDEYLDDLDVFWERVQAAAGGKKTFVLAHSHGSLAAIVWQKRQPRGISGMVLSAPYLRLALKPSKLKIFSSLLIGKVVPWLPVKNELQPGQLTRDPELQHQVAHDPLYNQVVTPRWFSEANKAQVEAMSRGPQLTVPVFEFLGSNDPIADTAAGKAFFETIGSADKTFKEYPDRVHEPMNDLGREQVWADISGWISTHL